MASYPGIFLKFQVFRNAISTILRQSQRILIAHLKKNGSNLVKSFKEFQERLCRLYILQLFEVGYFNLGVRSNRLSRLSLRWA